MTTRRVLLALLAGVLVGFPIFGVLVYRATTVENAERDDAVRRFEAVRSAIRAGDALLTLDDTGRIVRRAEPPPSAPGPVSRLGVLGYRAGEKRLITVDIPFWFLKLKGPAVQYALGGTGLDLERLEITAGDLERHGPALVIDHVRANGDRLLVWTE